jgi:hypothetical protein
LDIFNIHEKVVDDYGEYVQSFLQVRDERAEQFIKDKLIDERNLWPDALIQLNPAYEKASTVEDRWAAGRGGGQGAVGEGSN